MASQSLTVNISRIVVALLVVGLLLFVPAPILPPHKLAEFLQSTFLVSWKSSYFVAAIGLQVVFWGSLGILAAFVVSRKDSVKGRLLQMITVPILMVIISLIIRVVKVGHPPIWINAVVPVTACITGVWIGLGFLYKRGLLVVLVFVIVAGVTLWHLSGGHDAALTSATAKNLRRLVAQGSHIPAGEGRFIALYQIAFAPYTDDSTGISPLQHNRAAILALGITLGDEALAKFVGLNRKSKLMRQAALLRKGTTLRERGDLSQHFSISGALAVLENPLLSDAGGLMKEQLDVLARGSGFSFGDLAADRAGVLFAIAATNSEEDARAMQEFIKQKVAVSDILPPIADLPMNMSAENFRSEYGTVGSKAYRKQISEIETRLDSCEALTPLYSSRQRE
jgi:hypothetical protein